MNIRRLQSLNKEFFQKVPNVEAEAKRLNAEAFITDEVIEAFKVWHAKDESKTGLLTTENKEIKKKSTFEKLR